MANTMYVVGGFGATSKTFSKHSLATDFATGELVKWSDFLEFLENLPQNSPKIKLKNQHSEVSRDRFRKVYVALKKSNPDPRKFNLITAGKNGGIKALPISHSIEGQLILSLFQKRRLSEALYCFLAVVKKDTYDVAPWQSTNRKEFDKAMTDAEAMLASAKVVEVLPPSRTSVNEIKGLMEDNALLFKEMQGQIDDLKDQRGRLISEIDKLRSRSRLISTGLLKRAFRTFSKLNSDLGKFNESSTMAISHFKAKEEEARRQIIQSAEKDRNDWNNKFEKLKEDHEEYLKFADPVEMWRIRSRGHRTTSRLAWLSFLLLTFSSIFGAYFFVQNFGAAISDAFVLDCSTTGIKDCSGINAKGPLMVGATLFACSMVMWLIRLQYKIFLSERHLSLDAQDRCAFARSYLSMRKNGQVNDDNEAIILGALFRSSATNDISDTEGKFDVSAAAVIAKHLGK